MARLPWKPGEREKAVKVFNETGSVLVRNNTDGLMELPENIKGEEDRKPLKDILAAAKGNREVEPTKESPVIIGTRETPNEKIWEIIKPNTPIKRLSGYKEEVMPDGSIVSKKDRGTRKGDRPDKRLRDSR